MKKAFTLIVSVLLLHTAKAQTTYPSGITNCIARYDFATTQSTITSLQDVSGNNNNSSVVQHLVSTTSWRNIPNKAMLFDGESSYAIIPNSISLTPQAITMVALVKLSDFFDGKCQLSQVICKGFPGYIPGQYGLGVTDDVYDHDCFNYDSSHHQLIGYFNNSYFTTGMQPNTGNYIHRNKWYFLAISFDGQNLNYYQVPMDSAIHYTNISEIYSASNIPNSMGTNTQDISIGKHTNPEYPYWFDGVMDEVALFNKVLDKKEIQNVYDYLWNDGLVTATANIENLKNDFSLYPNPNNGSFTIVGSTQNDDPGSFEVRNILGQIIYSGILSPKKRSIKQDINIPAIVSSGTYYFVVRQSESKVVKQFTVIKN